MEPQNSSENPAYSFHLQMNEPDTLNLAICSLSDPKFNPEGLGRIDVNHEVFEITVRKDIYTCYFRLKASGMIKFECKNPVKSKMVNLRQVFRFFANATSDDIVTISLLEGSSDLSLMIGKESNRPDGESCIKLVEAEPHYGKCPDVTFMTEAIMLTEHLRKMIPFMVQDNVTQRVLMNFTYYTAIMAVGKKNWPYKYNDKIPGTRGLAEEQSANAVMTFPYTSSLMIASYLAPAFLMCMAFKPYDCMMIRFCLRELGDLVYLIPEPGTSGYAGLHTI